MAIFIIHTGWILPSKCRRCSSGSAFPYVEKLIEGVEMGMEVIVGIACLVIGAVIATVAMRSAKNGSLREADSKIQSAHEEAITVISDAKRTAETLKKEALLEAKEAVSYTHLTLPTT